MMIHYSSVNYTTYYNYNTFYIILYTLYYNNMNAEDITTQLIRPGLTYALSVLILNALCVHYFTAFSPDIIPYYKNLK